MTGNSSAVTDDIILGLVGLGLDLNAEMRKASDEYHGPPITLPLRQYGDHVTGMIFTVGEPPTPFVGVIDSGDNIAVRIPYAVARKARLEGINT
jgi:hypothetical protein